MHFWPPVSGIGDGVKKTRSWSWMNIHDRISESLDPSSEMAKKVGFGMNILDPKHCILVLVFVLHEY